MTLRAFGLVTLLTASTMTIEAARHGFATVDNRDTDVLGAVLYGLFSSGWWCALLVLYRLRATGTSRIARALLIAPLCTVVLAFLQTPADIFGLDQRSVPYMIVDLAWPLSMLLTFVASVAAVFARRLPSFARFVPLIAGSSVPLALLLSAFGLAVPTWVGDVHVVVGWVLLGTLPFLVEAPREAEGAPRAVAASSPLRKEFQ